MSCTYSFAGQVLDCKENAGGVKEIYICDKADLASFTIDGTTKKVLTITMESGKTFKTYQLRKQIASMTTNINTNDAAGTTYYQTDLIFSIPKMEASKRLELLALAVGNMAVIVRDNNEKYWALGFDQPVALTAGTAATGTNWADANQYSYTLQDMNKVAPYEITTSILAAVIDANISLPIPA